MRLLEYSMCVASLHLSLLGCTNFLKTGCLFNSSSTSRILWAVCFRGLTIAIGQLHHSRHNHRNVWTQQYVSLLHLFKDNKMIGRPDFSLAFSGTALLYCQVPESLIPALSWGGLLALKILLLTVWISLKITLTSVIISVISHEIKIGNYKNKVWFTLFSHFLSHFWEVW